jgi:hypothetical protein
MNKYDYVILGAGPTGLTLAWYLSKTNKKILLIEKKNRIGGMHSVNRLNNARMFSEHGPRIYVNNFFNFIQMLKDMNLDFYNFFTPYKFGISSIGGKSFGYFNLYEIMILSYAFFTLYINKSYKTESMLDFSNRHYFSNDAKWYINRLCLLTDGGGIERYSVHQFLQLINQNFFFDVYQPNTPNDYGFLQEIEKKLISQKNIDIMLNSTITFMNKNDLNNCIDFVMINNSKKIHCKNIILAVPPTDLVNFISNVSHHNSFGPYDILTKWEKLVRYDTYISMTFHWEKKLNLEKKWGFPETEWGIAYIVLSDYMKFKHKKSKTVISLAITVFDISKKIGKTPHQCSQKELEMEVFQQLKKSYPKLTYPDHIIFSENKFVKNKWVSNDYAFFNNKERFIDFKSQNIKNLYNCGTHNGKSDYAFTSLESAVTNGMELTKKLEPKINLIIKKPITILSLLLKIIIILIGYLFYINTFGDKNYIILFFIILTILQHYPKFSIFNQN